MRFVLTMLIAAVIFGLGQHFLGEEVMFWLSLAWLTGLVGFAIVGRRSDK